MKTYRINSFMTGLLYLLGTLFGVLSAITGGDVLSSLVSRSPVNDDIIMSLVVAEPSRLVSGAFFILLMGISLTCITIFLYPLFRKDNEELALGMLIFRGALEGTWYFITTLCILLLSAIGREFTTSGADITALDSLGKSLYHFQSQFGSLGTFFFLIGAIFLYISFYRNRLIPRWISLWGLIGVVPYMLYALLHLFNKDGGIGIYLQMILAPQEMVMAFWLILKGFDQEAVKKFIS